MRIPLQQMPVKAAGFTPLVALCKFLAHKEKFLSWMCVVVAIQQAQIGKLLPQIAGHFVEQRVFAVDNFIVRKGKNEILRERIEHRESDLVVLVFTMDRIVREVL